MTENLRQQLTQLPELFGSHVLLSAFALLLGVLVSVPTGLWVAHRPAARAVAMAVAGVIQTIPGLALLAAMVTLLGAFGFAPALAALFLYSLLPTLRNTVTGVCSVDSDVREAAIGLGMSPRQVLIQVELPLALPTIVAGVRTAAVWIVGTATLSTPVGQASLGNYIFSGLQTRNSVAVAVGCFAAAGLAIVVDTLLGQAQVALRKRSRTRGLLSAGGLLGVVVVGALCTLQPSVPNTLSAPSSNKSHAHISRAVSAPVQMLRIGAKTFTEQYVLAALLEQTLNDAGFATKRTESLGSSLIFEALSQGHIDLYVDYTGTLFANVLKRSDSQPRWRVTAATRQWLAKQYGIRLLGELGFENAYAIAMRRDTAQQLNITNLEELAAQAPRLVIGGDYEFFQRPEWTRLRDTYSLRFRKKRSFDSTFLYPAVRDKVVDVITAFSSDGRIAAYDLTVLEDPRGAFPPYDAVLLLGPRVANQETVISALQPVLGRIHVQAMQRASLHVDRDSNPQTPAMAARWLRKQIAKPEELVSPAPSSY